MNKIEKKGYYQKYIVQKADGSGIDKNADYFVLRLDKDINALKALEIYTDLIKNSNSELYEDLLVKLMQYKDKNNKEMESKFKDLHNNIIEQFKCDPILNAVNFIDLNHEKYTNLNFEALHISVAVTRDQISSLTQFGIDVIAMLLNVCLNEYVHSAIKTILSTITEKAERYEIMFDENISLTNKNLQLKGLLSDIKKSEIIVNGAVGSQLQDMAGFELSQIKTNLNSTGALYQIGKLGDNNLYVDPNMRWDDTRMIVIKDVIAVVDLIENDKDSFTVEGTMTPKWSPCILKIALFDIEKNCQVIKLTNLEKMV